MRTASLSSVEFFAVDMDPFAAGLHLVDERHRALVPRADDPRFVDRLFELATDARADVLIPTVDAELIPVTAQRERFESAGIEVVVAAGEAGLSRTLDKVLLAEACRAVARVPQTLAIEAGVDLSAIALPAIAKPRRGSGGRGVEVVEQAARLSLLVEAGDMLLQTFLPGAEYSVDVLARRDGTVAAAVPRVRLKVDSGIAVAARTIKSVELEGMAAAVVEKLELRGVINVQFRDDAQSRPHLLEVNPRLPGAMSITVASGVDMAYWMVAEALGSVIPAGLDFVERGVVRFWEDQVIDACAFDELAAAGFDQVFSHLGERG
jgi:carbamoyl-phosphate synthase large subunit